MTQLYLARRFVVASVLSGFLAFGDKPFADPVSCQGDPCPTYVVTPGVTTVSGPTLHVDSCLAFDGAYVLGDANVRVDARGETTGHCIHQLLSGPPPGVCTVVNGNGNGEDKTVNSIAVRYLRPGNPFEQTMGKIDGKNPETGTTPYFMPVLDSTDGSTSTGPKWYTPGLLFPGEHQIIAWTVSNTTVCNILPVNSLRSSVRINAVSCLPKWEQGLDGNGILRVVNMEEGDQKIKVYPPPSLESAAQAAMDAWGPALRARGVNVDFVIEPCVASDSRCILIYEISPGGPDCAQTTSPGVDANGHPAAAPVIKVRPNTWDDDYKNFLLTHEFGHVLGLANSACPVDRTVMQGGHSNCGSFPTPPPSAARVPTPSDLVASVMTAFRHGSTQTCPAF